VQRERTHIGPRLADITQIKNHLRSQITDVHLEDQLTLKLTMLEPQILMTNSLTVVIKCCKIAFVYF